jgi:hypothetical protein
MANNQKQEATNEVKAVSFEYEGESYTIDRDNMNNLELFEAIEDEQYIKATRGFLGKDQWTKFKDAHRDDQGRVPMEPLEGFLQSMMDALGSKN